MNHKFNAIVKHVSTLPLYFNFIPTINWVAIKVAKQGIKEDCLFFKKHHKEENLYTWKDLTTQIATNSNSLYTLTNQILAASTFELIALKKVGINFPKYAPANFFGIFHFQFEATLFCFNTFDKITSLILLIETSTMLYIA